MKDIRLDMQTRNIKDEYIDLKNYVTNENSEEIDKKKLISDIQGLEPKMIILVLCYRVQTEYRIGRIFGRIFGPGIRPNTYSAFLNYSAEYQSLNLWRETLNLRILIG